MTSKMLSGSRQVLSENKENSHTGGLLLGGAGSALSLLQGCGDDEASGMKGSFASSSGSSAVGQVAGSSKAVLAALRALQDKIRRLEIERSQALEEATQLRQQVKHLEVEIEHTKQREALANHKVMAEATATKERLYTEKAELEVKLARSEDRVKEQSKHISELEYRQRGVDDKLKVVEEEKTKGDARIKDLASQLAQAAAKERGEPLPVSLNDRGACLYTNPDATLNLSHSQRQRCPKRFSGRRGGTRMRFKRCKGTSRRSLKT